MTEHPDPAQLVTPNADDQGAEQAPSKRWPWSKAKVQTVPTRRDRREFRRATKP